jgi:DNA-binding transcriptional LysR family regulator
LVLTPLALGLKERVSRVREEATSVLRRSTPARLDQVERTLVIRSSDAAAAILAGPLTAMASHDVPRVRLCFIPEGTEDVSDLREGRVDVDVGAVDLDASELKVRRLYLDRFVAVVRRGHPLARGRFTAHRLTAFRHLVVSRPGKEWSPLDAWLARSGLRRAVAAVVPSFLAALVTVAQSDLVAVVPQSVARHAQRVMPLVDRPLSPDLPPVHVGITWHPRFDREPVHRWLREALGRSARAI